LDYSVLFGAPKEIWSDSAKNLNSKEIKSFAKVLNATKFSNSPYNKQSLWEKQVQRYKRPLMALLDTYPKEDPRILAKLLVNFLNNEISDSTKISASQLNFHKNTSLIDFSEEKLKPIEQTDSELERSIKIIQHFAFKNMKLNKETQKKYYDKKAKSLPELKKGDLVSTFTEKKKPLKIPWSNPKRVVSHKDGTIIKDNNLMVKSDKGKVNKVNVGKIIKVGNDNNDSILTADNDKIVAHSFNLHTNKHDYCLLSKSKVRTWKPESQISKELVNDYWKDIKPNIKIIFPSKKI